jgi:hypothetical protein
METTDALKQINSGAAKHNGHTYKFYFNRYFVDEASKYGDGAKC